MCVCVCVYCPFNHPRRLLRGWHLFPFHSVYMGMKGDWNFRNSDLVKNPDGTDILTLCWVSVKSGGPSCPNPHLSLPRWSPWDLFRSFKLCSDAKERVVCRKQREATASIYLSKTVTLVPEFTVEDLPMDRTATLFPAFAIKGLPLGRTPWWYYYYYYYYNTQPPIKWVRGLSPGVKAS